MPENQLQVIKTPGSGTSADDKLDKRAPLIVRGLIIGSGVVGLCLVARSVRYFTQFSHAREIPKEFYTKHFRLRGTIDAVTQDAKLRVVHRPLGKLPKWLQRKTVPGKLTLRLAGLEITNDGRRWLMENYGGRQVWFTLINRSGSDEIDSDVTKQGFLRRVDLNQELVRKGMARVRGLDDDEHMHALKTNAEYCRLVNRLIISEKWADRRGVGLWERDGWWEALASYPSQVKNVLENTLPYRLSAVAANAAVAGFKSGKAVSKEAATALTSMACKAIRVIRETRSGQASH